MTRDAWITAFAAELQARTARSLRNCRGLGEVWFGVWADDEPSRAADRWVVENTPYFPSPPAEPLPRHDSKAAGLEAKARKYEKLLGVALDRPVKSRG